MRSYPRLSLLFLSFILAYVLFHMGAFNWMETAFLGYGYLSMFLGGLLFSFGFTTPFGVAVFAQMAPHLHPITAAFVGGVGAFLADLLIFDIIRFSAFHREIQRLRTSRFLRWIASLFHRETISDRLRRAILWSFAGIIIASPLPDEFGVSLISGISRMKNREFAALCFLLNATGILLIVLAARSVS